ETLMQGFYQQLDLFRIVIDAAGEADRCVLGEIDLDLFGVEDLIDIADLVFRDEGKVARSDGDQHLVPLQYDDGREAALVRIFTDHGAGQFLVQETLYI